MPKISVLMPIYNTNEKHLREAIESILNQSYKDFEFLILNDSPDNINLDKVVKSYADPRIIYLKNEKNMGITPSRNRLLDMAKGEYLAIMDHDDISLPERFKKQVEFLDNNPDYGVVGSNAKHVNSRKKIINLEKDEQIKLFLAHDCAILHPASMIRKSTLFNNNIHYEERFSPAEDYGLWCELASYTKLYNLQEILFEYRWHETNTSKIQKRKMACAANRVRLFFKKSNLDLYEEFFENQKSITRINLFGVIPILKIFNSSLKIKVVLFGILPIFSCKTKRYL